MEEKEVIKDKINCADKEIKEYEEQEDELDKANLTLKQNLDLELKKIQEHKRKITELDNKLGQMKTARQNSENVLSYNMQQRQMLQENQLFNIFNQRILLTSKF